MAEAAERAAPGLGKPAGRVLDRTPPPLEGGSW